MRAQDAPPPAVGGPDADHRAWLGELRARARFGPRDRLGTANLVDAAARRRGAREIVDGTATPLARPLAAGSSSRGDGRPGFCVDVFYTDGPIGMGSDHVEIDCHGLTNTHVDAVNHIALDGTWYGGWPVDDPTGPDITDLSVHGLLTRAVVVDAAGVRGEPWVDPDRPVGADDIERALAASGVTFESGDALVLAMGRDRFEAAGHAMTGLRGGDLVPGVGTSAARWIVDHDVSILCWDFLDSNHPSEPMACVHLLNHAIGLVLVDNCDLAGVRATDRDTGALVVAPLAVPGGTGSLVQPLFLT
jgi:kynurenine formamidase